MATDKRTDEQKAADEQAAAKKQAFLAGLASPADEAEPALTVEVNGATVQALSGADHLRVKAFMRAHMMKAKPDGREEAMALGELAGYLAFGVIEPKLRAEEWLFQAERPGTAAKLEQIVGEIKRISGIEDIEVVLAKKVFAQMQGDTGSCASASSTSTDTPTK